MMSALSFLILVKLSLPSFILCHLAKDLSVLPEFSKNQVFVTSVFYNAFLFSIQAIVTLVFITSFLCRYTIKCLHNIPSCGCAINYIQILLTIFGL